MKPICVSARRAQGRHGQSQRADRATRSSGPDRCPNVAVAGTCDACARRDNARREWAGIWAAGNRWLVSPIGAGGAFTRRFKFDADVLLTAQSMTAGKANRVDRLRLDDLGTGAAHKYLCSTHRKFCV